MLQTTLLLILVIALVSLLMRFAMRWASEALTRDLRTVLKAAETIVEHEKVPDEWLARYRPRIAALRAAGKSENELEQVGQAARAHCLREFDRIILFFEKTNVTDSPDTRRTLMTSLREQRARWAAAPWQELLAQAGAASAPATAID